MPYKNHIIIIIYDTEQKNKIEWFLIKMDPNFLHDVISFIHNINKLILLTLIK